MKVILSFVILHLSFVASFSQTAEDYYKSGNDKSKRADYQGAIADYTKAIELKSDYAEAYHNRGAARDALKDYREAKKDLAEAYNLSGNAKYLVEDYSGAVKDWTEVLDLRPDLTEIYIKRGMANYVLHSTLFATDAGVEDFANDYLVKASAKHKLGDYKGAIANCTKAIALQVNHKEAYLSRATAKCNLGDYAGAIVDYSKVIILAPVFLGDLGGNVDYEALDYPGSISDLAGAYNSRGKARYALKDYRGALADFAKAIRTRDGDYAEAYYNKGKVNGALGLKNEECKDLNKAKDLGYAVPENELKQCE